MSSKLALAFNPIFISEKTVNSHAYFENHKHKTISSPQERQQSKTGISSSNTGQYYLMTAMVTQVLEILFMYFLSLYSESVSFITEVDVAIAQLSNQLSQIEELREVNQAQVNHVLRSVIFLF